MPSRNIFQQYLVPVLFIVLSAYTIAHFLSQLILTPDSTGYISAAQNFLRTGRMVQYANSPSWSLSPGVEPFTEQPPGFPLFLVPFLAIFKQPILAASVAQSCAILILYFAIFAITRDFGAGPFFQVVCALVFTLFRPLQYAYSTVTTETLFIALSLWSIHFLIAAKFHPTSRRYWIAALLFAAAASYTRSIGALMLAVFILVSWQRKQSRWISVASSVVFVGGPLVVWALRNKILYGSTSVSHTINSHIAWEKLFPQFVFLLDSTSRNAFVISLIAIFSILCIAAPFIGQLSAQTRAIHFRLDLDKSRLINIGITFIGLAVAVLALAADRLGFGGDPDIGLKQIGIALLGILAAIAPWLRNTNLLEILRSWVANYDWNRWKTQPMYTFSLLFLAGLSHFWGITALSLITPFSDLRNRLLAPSLAILLFSGLVGMYFLIRQLPGGFFTASIYVVAFGSILLSPFFVTTGLPFTPSINIPPEQELWKEIYQLPGIDKVSHFYTDYNFTHEIYSNRPQRIILDVDRIGNPGFLTNILATGQCPFVLVSQGDQMSELMDQHFQEAGLSKLEMLDGQFELFAQPCLLTP